MPARLLAVTPETELSSILPALRPRQVHLFLCVNAGGQELISEEAVWRAVLEGRARTMGEVKGR